MTKKDYIIIANVLSMPVYNGAEEALKIDIVNRLCKEFIKDNARFDERKFKEACKLQVF